MSPFCATYTATAIFDPALSTLNKSADMDHEAELAAQANGIAQARESAAAGHVVDSAKVKAWIDSIGTSQELPVPYAGR